MILAKQLYSKVIREISSVKQIEREEIRAIYLFAEKITTAHREFPLSTVLDLSFRQIGNEGGQLYIHTDHGVYSYIVKYSPEPFIQKCKEQMDE